MVIVENLVKSEELENIKYFYFYRIIKSKVSLFLKDEEIKVQSYGIEVERQDIINGDIVRIERNYIKNISPERYKVHKLLKLLRDNSVSPIHLVDVLGEYIDEYIIDFDNVLKNIAAN
ncbi:hypothetical protein CLOACE_03420 [Clostridium acetireducens DSM 10703]|jgi:hypothetical protein|uniref:Uncharacterized protein n=1 Tax=Clostridium acetireducens DSM 10703 TaxID=1121290 RepID=A0A1E8F1L0_9CLOT|nr:DUF6514 family protein [Clostridium acetireducens]OFI07513.1 hypothetical protein CLOACE_03420 [Clostridium acetireducens DSM 10703]